MTIPFHWGVTSEECSLAFPCDRFSQPSYIAYFRGITVMADPETIFRWLCQLKAAPYSYDWLDNWGRQSPQRLIPGLDDLAAGQSMMFFFEVIDFERPRHVTVRQKPKTIGARVFGDVVVSYLIVPQAQNVCRLLAKAAIRHPAAPMGWLTRILLPWGDLIMMRRQLLNFKQLSEKSVHGA
ncbi:MAG: hypothetical protein HY611_10620 [Elusimicrobia bacterium]|nr:hypothetical protein [Elusimicrobiota bacterium]